MPVAMKKGLGRGMSALFPSTDLPLGSEAKAADMKKDGVLMIDINRIEPNKQQPRRSFDEDALGQLADSIRSYGIIQPLIVKDEGGYYSIIAGERRWRAARMAKLTEVPVLVKDYTESDRLQIALIENLQREDLNPIEEATCYKKLIDDFFFTQEDVAKRVGKSRNSISYAIGLLTLDPRVQDFISDGKLAPSSARLLTKLKDPDKQLLCAERIIERDMNTHDAERLVNTFSRAVPRRDSNLETLNIPAPSFKHIEDDLKTLLGTKVSIHDGKKKGVIEIEYYSKDELDRLLLLLKKAGGPAEEDVEADKAEKV
jgi:ParB family chromosome partitioning protein